LSPVIGAATAILTGFTAASVPEADAVGEELVPLGEAPPPQPANRERIRVKASSKPILFFIALVWLRARDSGYRPAAYSFRLRLYFIKALGLNDLFQGLCADAKRCLSKREVAPYQINTFVLS